MTIGEILEKTGQSESVIMHGHVLLTTLAKLSRYEAECELFKKKYGVSLIEFQERLGRNQTEDFSEEDDLMDWEFAEAALKWWKGQAKELRCAD